MSNYKTFRKIKGEKSLGFRMNLKVLRLDIKSRIHFFKVNKLDFIKIKKNVCSAKDFTKNT